MVPAQYAGRAYIFTKAWDYMYNSNVLRSPVTVPLVEHKTAMMLINLYKKNSIEVFSIFIMLNTSTEQTT